MSVKKRDFRSGSWPCKSGPWGCPAWQREAGEPQAPIAAISGLIPFTSFRAGTSYLNLIDQPAERRWSWWGRVIFYVTDVDALYERAPAEGYKPATVPGDAEWGERFFRLVDPDGHELSFARPLLPASVQ